MAVFVLGCATAQAGQHCIRLDWRPGRELFILNDCPFAMDVSVCVEGNDSRLPSHGGSRHFTLAAFASRFLWSDLAPPAVGLYRIVALACALPLVVHDRGTGKPYCDRLDDSLG
jgi:hypothetical protein